MTTVSQAVTDIVQRIEGQSRPAFERLNGAVNTGAELVVLEFGDRNVHNGTYLEIDDEVLYVADASTASEVVIRAMVGTTDVIHADNSLVKIDPRVTRQYVKDELREQIRDLPDDLYQVTTVDVSFAADTPYAELTGASGLEVIRAWAERDPDTTGQPYVGPPLRVVRNDASSTGWFVQIEHGASYTGAETLEVSYAHRYDPETAWADTTDLTSDVGIPVTFISGLYYGVIHRVLLNEETVRNQTRSATQARRDDEVMAGVLLQVADAWERKFKAAVAREASRLRRAYPIVEVH